MSLLGTFNPNPARSQSVVSHNSTQLPAEHDLDMVPDPEKNDDEDTAQEEEENREVLVGRLARQLTRQSTRFSANGPLDNPFTNGDSDSSLNPNSPKFKVRDWMKMLLAIRSRSPDKYPDRTAGISFKNLSVHGFGSPTDYQKDVLNSILELGTMVRRLVGLKLQRIQILRDFDGLVKSGETLVVLGKPGSGCSTLLKTIAGEMNGIEMSEESFLNYQGISAKDMQNSFKGEAIYAAETDVHFPQLSVGDTLMFAALARAPRNRLEGVETKQYAEHMRDVVMAMLGLSHTINTRVGNDFIRGVSGGERKRVSIAEATLSQSPLQCWDNSTRGLDSANALEFCRNLALMSKYSGTTACVAIYQASQNAYDVFDKVTLLYEGRQIYFGPATEARKYFEDMGYECPDRQTTADFLTSITSSSERVVRSGFENRAIPRTPDEFAAAWKRSDARAKLLIEIEEYERNYPIKGSSYDAFVDARRAIQDKHQRVKSPYTISIRKQISLCVTRGFQRLRGDYSLTATALVGNFIMALIIGSVFVNLPKDTSSFYSRGALLFFAVLLNAFSSALEILTLYAQRPIVEKQARYAFYHPFAEALASMLCDTPYKLINSFTFNIPLYFMTDLRREAGAFFTFWLFSIITTFTMSMIFRTIAASSRSLSQALVPAAILILGMVIYTGFVIPTRNMLGWSRWMNYINPVAYAFESFMVNEFQNRYFECAAVVPSGGEYDSVSMDHRICSTVGAQSGSTNVSGSLYLSQSFGYLKGHLWRNFGILIAFLIFFMFTYLLGTEYISEKKSKGEVLLFRRGHQPKHASGQSDLETSFQPSAVAKTDDSPPQATAIQRQTAIFHWQDVCYDIKIKGEPRRILDNVDGWVKPGTCTALMGVSGAGKTTLLDVLATRVTMGVVTGEMLVDGHPTDQSFQRKTGYVQQQDLHLSTSTVREALVFSALLRQPATVSRQEKLDYADEVIKLLGMEAYADAVVGVPGEGLNVEQRKRLTIGVELAAKPQLLLFLDEPTSGLDSQTSWSILDLIDTLTKHGQAILCTIHQPSAMLFQRFDRLLFLAKGGRTIYFGEIGENSSTLSNYFQRNGAHHLTTGENPAEWMLDVIGAAPGTHSEIEWPMVWRNSPEYGRVKEHLSELKSTLSSKSQADTSPNAFREFAAPFHVQLWECLLRVFAQYFRTPTYIWSKAALCILTSLYIGFSFFHAQNSIQGLQNQMFSVFMLMTIFGNLVQQIMPNFVTQRSLYEVRERPSKAYSWKAFMMSNILVELPWNTLMAVFIFFCWYYPIGLYRNAEPDNAVSERGALMFLLIWTFLLFTSTFAHMVIAGIELAETGGNIATMLFSLCLIFCGVLSTKEALPGFWIFMYRVSPFTYLVSAMLSTGVSGADAVCEAVEFLKFNPPANQTCQDYMDPFIKMAGTGYLKDPMATTDCAFCTVSKTNTYLLRISSDFADAWRNFGLMWVYIVANIFGAVFIYWLARVPKGKKTTGST